MTQYRAPGLLDELNLAKLGLWSDEVSGQLNQGIAVAMSEAPLGADNPWFYNGITNSDAPASVAAVKWTAFPRTVATSAATPTAARKIADGSRDNQDEYCEWSVIRDAQNKVQRVIFTTETPDYYTFLAKHDTTLLLDIYHRFVSPSVQLSDLLRNGQYNRDNRWNMPPQPANDGFIVHMRQGANNLRAAVLLAAQASWPRRGADGQLITAEQPLIRCAQFGEATRNSDPHIGAQVNALVRAGNQVTLADPPGLYIDNIDFSGWERPDGGDPSDLMRIERGTEGFAMRMAFAAPIGATFALGDVTIDGDQLKYGGQIAERMKIRLSAATQPKASAPAIVCSGVSGGLVPTQADDEADPFASRSRSGLRYE
jgi:hypothetical protein